MRIAVTAVDAVTTHAVDVLLDLAPETTMAEVEQALAPLLPGALGGTWVGETEAPGPATVAEAGLRPGSFVSLGGPLRTPRPPAARYELRVVSGPESGAIYLLPDGDSTAGTSAPITLQGPGVAPEQLLLQSGPTGVSATNLHADQPARRGGQPLSGAVPLAADDVLEVGRHLVSVVPVTDEVPGLLTPSAELGLELQRPERRRPLEDHAVVELPAPPSEPAPPKVDLRLLAVPVLAAVLLGLLADRRWLWLVLLAPALVALLHRRQKAQALAAEERAEEHYEQERTAASAEIRRLSAVETTARRAADPDAAAVLRIAGGHDPRLWERRPGDPDFLRLRFGTSRATARTWEVLAPAGVTAPPPTLLDDVPFCVDLAETGTLALTGPADLTEPLARWLVGQAAALHSPQDLAIWLLVDPGSTTAERQWSWVRWLPHTARLSPAGEPAGGLLVGNTEASLAGRLAELQELVAQRLALAEDPRSAPLTPPPAQLVVVDGAVANGAAAGLVADLLRDGPRVGVHLVCLLLKDDQLPQRCGAELWFEGSGRVALRRPKQPEVSGVRVELVRVAWAEKVARALAPVRLRGAAPSTPPLPVLVPATELLGEALGADFAWGEGSQAPVGRTTDGVMAFDLGRDGPHGVVAGASGSGRTELMRTLACSLAATRRPDSLGLLLLGPAFADLAELPHALAVLDPAEPAALSRALTSVVAEAGRREVAQLSAPALVLLVDDVDALLSAVPSARGALDQLVQRGGPAGIHLVLGTSQPSALMSARLRDTAGLRVALRLDSSAESLEVLESPAAAAISRSTPGRAYARVRQGRLVGFQSALLEGRGAVAPARAAGVTVESLSWATLGDRPAPSGAPEEAPRVAAQLVRELGAAARRTGVASVPPPWLPPLPDAVAVADLGAGGSGLSVAFGLADLPAEQAQRPAVLDLERGGHVLVAGDPRSGRSTFLTTVAASLAASASPSEAHLYALDCGGGALLPLAQLPHCGAVVVHHESDRADRLLARLAVEVARRRRQLSERGFADLAAQRAGSADPLPYLVLLVDGWEGFTEVLGAVDGGRLRASLLDLVRDGGPAGLRVLVTGDPSTLADEVAALLPERYLLRCDDRSAFAAAGLAPELLPAELCAGRMHRAPDGTAVQVARLSADSAARAQSAAIDELASTLPPARGRRPFRVDLLPDSLTLAEARALGVTGVGTELAVGGDELRLQTVNLSACGPGFTIAGPAGSGRSTALLVLAQSLLERGGSVCLLTPRRSPLRELADLPGVLANDWSGLARVLAADTRPLAVVVDDAELVDDDEQHALLQKLLQEGRRTDRSLVLAGATEDLAGQTHGFAYAARRSRSGLLLSPEPDDGDLLGVALPPSAGKPGRPGRGVLVRSGELLQVQVPLP